VEDKTFELMTRMYNEFTSFKSDMNEFRMETNKRFDTVDGHIVRLENEHGQKLDTLFDGYKQLTEGQEEIKSQLKELSSKVEKQDMQITFLKSKKKAAIS